MNIESPIAENPSEGIFVLPGGFFQNGDCLREVKLRLPTGWVEEQLANPSKVRCLAEAITTLLTHGIERIGPITDITPEIVRSLLVGDRDYLVLKLRQITNGNNVEATLVCPNPQCGEKIDIDFELNHIPVKHGKISSQVFTMSLEQQKAFKDDERDKDWKIEFRLPNGGDQEGLALLTVHDESKAVHKVLTQCIQRIDGSKDIDESKIGKLSIAERRKIEKTMADLAPQVDMEFEAACPECEQVFSFPFNLSQFFLEEFKGNINQLYQEVHFLAFYYHWSELDILSMTRKKRQKYLQLLSDHIAGIKQGDA